MSGSRRKAKATTKQSKARTTQHLKAPSGKSFTKKQLAAGFGGKAAKRKYG